MVAGGAQPDGGAGHAVVRRHVPRGPRHVEAERDPPGRWEPKDEGCPFMRINISHHPPPPSVRLLLKPLRAHIADFRVATPLAFAGRAAGAVRGDRSEYEAMLVAARLEVEVQLVCGGERSVNAQSKFDGGPEAPSLLLDRPPCSPQAAATEADLEGVEVAFFLQRLKPAAAAEAQQQQQQQQQGCGASETPQPLAVVPVSPGRWYARDSGGAPGTAAAGAGGVAKLSVDAAEALGGPPLLWSAEEPHLYTLILELRKVNNSGTAAAAGRRHETLEFEACQASEGSERLLVFWGQASSLAAASWIFLGSAILGRCLMHYDHASLSSSLSQLGFRHTEVSGPRLLHNGRPIMLRGVNRHEFDPWRGKAISEEDMVADLTLMKRSGFNAVRCSHYPNCDRWCVIELKPAWEGI